MEYYDNIAEGYNELYEKEQLEKLNVIKKHLKVQEPLLDIGAGTGISTSFFNVKAIALDPSKKMLEKYKGKKFLGTAEDIPLPDNTFRTIISVSALHHSKNIKNAIREIKRVSKDNATYAFTILKKSKNFKNIVKELKKNFNLKEYDSQKDLILISP